MKLFTSTKRDFALTKEKAKNLAASAVVGVLMLNHAGAQAQSATNAFQTGANNFKSVFDSVALVIKAGGVVGGLGCIAWGISEMMKKGGDRGDDITWMSVGYKVFGGAMMMVLGWVASAALGMFGASTASQ